MPLSISKVNPTTISNFEKVPLENSLKNFNVQPNYLDNTSILNLNSSQCSNYYNIYSEEQIFLKNYENISFNAESNSDIYVVRVKSLNGFYLINATCNHEMSTIGKLNTSIAFISGCFFTNKKSIYTLMSVWGSEVYKEGELRYEHYKFLHLKNYTYDKRKLYYKDNSIVRKSTLRRPWEIPFSPGTWYFIFSGTIYDLPQENISSHWSIKINFIGNKNGFDISTYEGGKIFGLWYGEYKSNVVISKSHAYEFMLNGRASFNIDNNFIFLFHPFPNSNGFWNIFWKTPTGYRFFNMLIFGDNKYFIEEKKEGTVYGFEGPGKYQLSTSYLDKDPINFSAHPPWFFGMDVELP